MPFDFFALRALINVIAVTSPHADNHHNQWQFTASGASSMHVPFLNVRCPSCGSTFHPDASVLSPGGGNAISPSPPEDQPKCGALLTPKYVLHSWKEIASYLGLAVRTAERWEHDFGLPVHRPAERERTAVFAFPEEIDSWLQRTPVGLPSKASFNGSSRSQIPARAAV